MAGCQRHLVELADIPGVDDNPARAGVVFYEVDGVLDLVDGAAVGCLPRAPLLAVDRPEVAVFVGPFVPDRDVLLLQIGDISIALEKPQELADYRAQVKVFGGQTGKAIGEGEAQLIAESREGTDAGAVGFFASIVEAMADQIEVLLHVRKPSLRFC